MIPLPETFREGGFGFKLVAREGSVALFKKTKPRIESATFYEVVIVQMMNDHTWPDGHVSPAHEYMPGSEKWGNPWMVTPNP
jgi:hypothetical protein